MPVTSRKTTEVHAEYVNYAFTSPTKAKPYRLGKHRHLHTPRTFIGYCSDWLRESFEVSGSRKQRSINAFFNMSFVPPTRDTSLQRGRLCLSFTRARGTRNYIVAAQLLQIFYRRKFFLQNRQFFFIFFAKSLCISNICCNFGTPLFIVNKESSESTVARLCK